MKLSHFNSIISIVLKLTAALLILATKTTVASAKTIETPYLTFEVPDSYACESQEAYYQCQDSSGPKMKDSILIVAFKRAGPQDSVDQYVSLLSRPFTRVNRNAPPSLSRVEYSKKSNIKSWPWAEAKHFESDLTNYFTYHWSTVRGPVAMVIKYSVLGTSDSKRQPDIQIIAQSFATKEVQFSPPPAQNAGASGLAGAPNTSSGTAASPQLDLGAQNETSWLEKFNNLKLTQKALLFAIVGGVLFLLGYAVLKK